MSLVEVYTGDVRLAADVTVPENADGIVIFAHGSGSSRHSPRNRAVAGELNRCGLATVLMDLLTPDEDRLRFDIALLTERLIDAIDGIRVAYPALPVGLFGASTGGAAALVAAATRPDDIRAVVSRGGRPDLAGTALTDVRAPTLLIVGERDPLVIDLNERALAVLTAPAELRIVPGATHLFEEPGTLDEVARQAADWFTGALPTRPS